MGIGMFLHRLAPPRPPKPNFSRTIPSTVSAMAGVINLHFYVPKDYEAQKGLWTGRARREDDTDERHGSRASAVLSNVSSSLRARTQSGRRWGGYPVVINFHGGGFTLGTAMDDARWCGTVVDELNAVVVSVDYRLAPECPFPTAVEDGVDAVLWVHKHASELGIDTDKIALSGFSSGGNMAFTVPLRLYDHLTNFALHQYDDFEHASSTANLLENQQPPATASSDVSTISTAAPAPEPGNVSKSATTVAESSIPTPEIQIACIVPWYPSLDYTRTREERRATCRRADQELPALFTDLFDDSYLHPPKEVSLDSPYLSPGVAPTSLLRNALPQEIIMHTCEWDMLLHEGEEFHERLIKAPQAHSTADDLDDGIGKTVHYTMIHGVPHGWDKAPNPLKPTPGVREHYLRACREMRRILGQGGQLPERRTQEGFISAAPQESARIVR